MKKEEVKGGVGYVDPQSKGKKTKTLKIAIYVIVALIAILALSVLIF